MAKTTGELPDTTGTFQIDVEGEITKKRFLGDFSCHIPTLKDRSLIAKHRAFLNGEFILSLDPMTLQFHAMVAYLRYTLDKYPDFWKESDLGYNLYDRNVVRTTYEKVLEFEESWLKEVWGSEAVEDLKNKDSE